jgi:hypothetical protein
MTATRCRIVASDPNAHLFEVSCTVTDPDRDGQAFRLPAWSPGSYLIREFARNLVAVRAECVGIEHHLRPAANATDMGGKPASNPAPQVWLGASFTPGPDLPPPARVPRRPGGERRPRRRGHDKRGWRLSRFCGSAGAPVQSSRRWRVDRDPRFSARRADALFGRARGYGKRYMLARLNDRAPPEAAARRAAWLGT